MPTEKNHRQYLINLCFLALCFSSFGQEKLKTIVQVQTYGVERDIDSIVFSSIGLEPVDQVECNLLRIGNGALSMDNEFGTNIQHHVNGIHPELPFNWASGKTYFIKKANGVAVSSSRSETMVMSLVEHGRTIASGNRVFQETVVGDTTWTRMTDNYHLNSTEIIKIRNDKNQIVYSYGISGADTLVKDEYEYLGDQIINHVRTYSYGFFGSDPLVVYDYYEYYGDQLVYTQMQYNGLFGTVISERNFQYDSLNRLTRIDEFQTEPSIFETIENEHVYFIEYDELATTISKVYYPDNEPGVTTDATYLKYFKPGYLAARESYRLNGDGTMHFVGANYYYYESQLKEKGIQEFKTETINVFPNPVENFIRFFPARENATYSVFTLKGIEVKRAFNVDRMDLSDLASGMYVLRIQNGSEIQMVRINNL